MQTSLSFRIARVVLSLLLLAAPLAGCGKEPMKPLARSKQFKGPASRTPNEIPPDDDPGPGDPGVMNMPLDWHGGPSSLPVGPNITPAEVEATVDSIESIRMLMTAFAARGYIRHAERDTAVTGSQNTTLILRYEKPGTSMDQAQPIILVVTQKQTGWLPCLKVWNDGPPTWQSHAEWTTAHVGWLTTQVGGMMLGVTDGDSLAILSSPEDGPLHVVASYLTNDTLSVESGGATYSFAASALPSLNGSDNWDSGAEVPTSDVSQAYDQQMRAYYYARSLNDELVYANSIAEAWNAYIGKGVEVGGTIFMGAYVSQGIPRWKMQGYNWDIEIYYMLGAAAQGAAGAAAWWIAHPPPQNP